MGRCARGGARGNRCVRGRSAANHCNRTGFVVHRAHDSSPFLAAVTRTFCAPAQGCIMEPFSSQLHSTSSCWGRVGHAVTPAFQDPEVAPEALEMAALPVSG